MVAFLFDVLKKKKLVVCKVPDCDARIATAGIKHIIIKIRLNFPPDDSCLSDN